MIHDKWIRFNFENTFGVYIPISAIKWMDIGKLKKIQTNSHGKSYKTTRTIAFIFDKDFDEEYDYCGEKVKILELLAINEDIIDFEIYLFDKIKTVAVPWVEDEKCRFCNILRKGKKMKTGDYLLVFKGNDTNFSPDELLVDCEKQWIKEGSLYIKRIKPKKRGLCRRYFDRNIPFEMLKYPKKKDYAIYSERVIEYYDQKDKESSKKVHYELDYDKLSEEEKRKEDKKSRDYLNFSVDWADLGLPRTHNEYQLWRFRHERYKFDLDNTDYSF